MLQYPQLDPVIVTIGPLAVRWYGLMYVLGFLSAWLLGRRRAKRQEKCKAPFTPGQFDDVLIWGLFGVIVGARLGYVFFYNPGKYLAPLAELSRLFEDPLGYLQGFLSIFAIWRGGMSFHGGLIGVVLFQWLAGRKYGRSFFETIDFMAPLVPPGLFFGRMGNFINAELWGRVTDAPWGMVFPEAGPAPRHPSQLYEAFLEGLVLFALLWWFSSRPRPRMAVSGVFALGYGVFRFCVEFVREPDAHIGFIWGGFLTMGMLLCLPLVLLGSVLLFLAYRKKDDTIRK